MTAPEVPTDPRLAREHSALLRSAETILGHLGNVEGRLDHGDIESSWHREWAHRAAWLHGHLSSSLALIRQNQYVPAFSLVRVGLEHHLVDRLIFLGTAIVEEWRRGERDVDEWEAELERLRLDEEHTVVAWEPKGAKRETYRVVQQSPRLRGTSDVSISWYHFSIDDYDPTTPRANQLPRVRRNFEGLDQMRASAKRARAYWETYFRLPRVLENLEESGLLTAHERLQVDLHYSFLSGFVHATGHGYSTIRGRWVAVPVPPEYDHYCSELVLLYVIRIAAEELRHLKRAYELPPTVGVKGWPEVERDLQWADAASEHFWFLGTSAPHLFDRVMSVDDEMFELSEGDTSRLVAMNTLDPMALTLDQIRYEPDPLRRLIQMHSDRREMTTGAEYRSPFRRPDADYR